MDSVCDRRLTGHVDGAQARQLLSPLVTARIKASDTRDIFNSLVTASDDEVFDSAKLGCVARLASRLCFVCVVHDLTHSTKGT